MSSPAASPIPPRPRDLAPTLDRARSASLPGLSLLFRSVPGVIGLCMLAIIGLLCLGSLPWTVSAVVPPGLKAAGDDAPRVVRFDLQNRQALRLPPSWTWPDIPRPAGGATEPELAPGTLQGRIWSLAVDSALRQRADETGVTIDALLATKPVVTYDQAMAALPTYLLGTDVLGRDVMVRCLVGGGISMGIGLAAATIAVFLGTMYGALAGYLGGRIDGVMMRIVDVLYGLPYILLVVLLAVAVDGTLDAWQQARARDTKTRSVAFIDAELARTPEAQRTPETRARLEVQARERFGVGELSQAQRLSINVVTLLVAIGGVSWLTMARVIRGQVLSLKAQPFVEAARAIGVSPGGIFTRHLLPNLVGPIIVYATLTVPQAILQESFLSFLGIGVDDPLPSWGKLAADGLGELNLVNSQWWLLLWPCVLLGLALLSLNFVGEGLREALDPRRRPR